MSGLKVAYEEFEEHKECYQEVSRYIGVAERNVRAHSVSFSKEAELKYVTLLRNDEVLGYSQRGQRSRRSCHPRNGSCTHHQTRGRWERYDEFLEYEYRSLKSMSCKAWDQLIERSSLTNIRIALASIRAFQLESLSNKKQHKRPEHTQRFDSKR